MTLSYELAKELDDNGFPQPDFVEDGNWDAWALKRAPKDRNGWEPVMARAYSPSLDELIEACPKRFPEGDEVPLDDRYTFHLRFDDGYDEPEKANWRAGYTIYDVWHDLDGHGATPKEAVAKLWLALRKEGKV